MPIYIRPRYDFRETVSADDPSVSETWIVTGTEDQTEVKAAVEITIPAFYDSKLLQRYDIEHDGAGVWIVEAHYGRLELTPPNSSTFSFDTGGGTTHLTQSLLTIDSYSPPTSASNPFAVPRGPPDYQGAIGVQGDDVQGIDITIPVYNFSETHYILAEAITRPYTKTLFALTGQTNDDDFRGFSRGEVLFLGASGQKRGLEDWEITFKFSASPDKTGIKIGNIEDIEKAGWDYLWVSYKDKLDEESKRTIKVPASVHVERVYYRGDFSQMGIGVD